MILDQLHSNKLNYSNYFCLFQVVTTAANITTRLVKEKTMDWINTSFPSEISVCFNRSIKNAVLLRKIMVKMVADGI